MERTSTPDGQYADVFAFSPAGDADLRLGLVLAAVLAAVAALSLPWAQAKTPYLDTVLPTFGAIALLAEFLAAGLFVSQYVVSRQPPLLYLSVGLSIKAVFNVMWWSAMPHVYSTHGFYIKSLQTGPWLFIAGSVGFLIPLGLMAACDAPATARCFRDRRTIAAFCAASAVVAAGCIAVAYGAPGLLPPLVDRERLTAFAMAVVVPVMGALVVAAFGLVTFVKRPRHAVDVWLAVALVSIALEIVVTAAGGGRDALGFYVGRVLGASSASAILLQMLLKMYGVMLALMHANRDLDSQATTDELTGLANRRSFNRVASGLFAEQRSDDRRAALLMIDLDEFKRYNDGFGHAAGDTALATVAQSLRRSVSRAHDLAARVGGEEFAVILRDTDLDGAVAVAERIREAVEAMGIAHAPGAAHRFVTVSIGVASTIGNREIGSFGELAASADAALYVAKSSGRNRVTVAPA